ncbi:helix-turn-helix transcriptional regulator [Cuspidothrix issatschenkoi LEGE 03284]|jgi:transcriptional regulator with XRE-family HTH domain|uniref:helix-turn-helix domain-containing protein n=1 Tax=Cuspidothrix issatschenkoi TaxID=230752 RepID=UPI0018827980|nr:helix-turn-helix transcriptional regulator [Cuspidothrix issatschenkoi]MBE9232644.1 helix-turn-helix transcriptional regulator [Cuspidothrix issatschenkoi LEGE 03284]
MTTSNNENIQKKFGSRLRQIRQNIGLSQEELAHLSNLDRSYVGGVERGERNISLVNIHKIADALNISPKEFFND